MAMATLSYPHQCRSPGEFLPSFHGLRANFSGVKMPISSIPTIRRNRRRDCRIQAAVLPLISFDGQSLGNAELELRTARPETAKAVVHRGLITEMANKRQGTASTLTRAEVRGGGRKPYKQKGTGNARRGSQRTPLRPGGGVIFGPKPKDWSMKINKKEKRLAITTALQSAAVNAVVVEDFYDKFQTPKTRDFISALNAWGVKEEEHSLIFTTEVPTNLSLSSRNLKTVKLVTPRTLNLYDVLRADKLVFTKSGVDYLNQMYGINASEDEDEP